MPFLVREPDVVVCVYVTAQKKGTLSLHEREWGIRSGPPPQHLVAPPMTRRLSERHKAYSPGWATSRALRPRKPPEVLGGASRYCW